MTVRDQPTPKLTLRCHCGAEHVLDVGVERDPRGTLLVLRDGPLGLHPSTLRRWARAGRLAAFEAERGKLVCWERDLRAAVEARPMKRAASTQDPAEAAFRSGRVRTGPRQAG